MAEPIRVGVVGAGGIFRNLHVPYYQHTSLAKIVAVTDVNEDAARGVAEQLDAALCRSCEDLIARDDVDAVAVCTHPKPHRDIVVAAAQAGKHVLVEKPMCCTVAEGTEMVDAARAAGVQLQVAYMMRFHPCLEKVKALIDEGVIGDVHMAYCDQIGWFPPKHPWLFIKEESGGMLVEQAIHNLDLWLWLLGDADSVFARTSTASPGGTYPPDGEAVENNAVVTVTFRSGATGMLIKSWAAEVGHKGEGLVASRGSVEFSQQRVVWKTHDTAEPEEFTPTVPDDGSYGKVPEPQRTQRYWSMASKGRGIEHWLRCILGEEEPTTSGEVGRAGIAIAEAAYRSAETGQPVAVAR